jgi:hypothetical protein
MERQTNSAERQALREQEISKMTEVEKIGQGIFNAVEKQAEEILDFLLARGYKNPAVSFSSFSNESDPPIGRRHDLMLNIQTTIPRPQN